jgi:hypothetical protein
MKKYQKVLTAVVVVILLFTMTKEEIAFARTAIYTENLEDAQRDLALCAKLGEDEVTVYYTNECSNIDITLKNMFYKGFRNENIGDFYLSNVYRMDYNFGEADDMDCKYVQISFTYSQTADEVAYVMNRANQYVNSYKRKWSRLSTAEQYRWIYDYIIKNIDYDYDLEHDSAYEAVEYTTATCMGYTQLYYIMARAMGLPCKIVDGTVDGEGHTWNLGEVNGQWYYIDATWGDDNPEEYFLRSRNNIKDNRTADLTGIENLNWATEDYK